MTGPKTLTEAREQLEAAETKITGLTATMEALDAFLKDSGITRTTAEDGSIHFEIPQLVALTEQNSALAESLASLTADNKTLAEIAAGRETSIATLTTRIAELESTQKTAETRAREMVGSLGGPPLAVDASDGAELTVEVLRTQLLTEKDPNAQYAIYKKIKAQEAKAKINGHRR